MQALPQFKWNGMFWMVMQVRNEQHMTGSLRQYSNRQAYSRKEAGFHAC
jgi:hypothetical protein